MFCYLVVNSFIELPESNQTFEEKQGHFNSPGQVKQGEKKHATYSVASRDLKKFIGKSKKNNLTM